MPVEEDVATVVFDGQGGAGGGEQRGRSSKRPRVKGPSARPATRAATPSGPPHRNGAGRIEREREEREDRRGGRAVRPQRPLRGVAPGALGLTENGPASMPSPSRPAPFVPSQGQGQMAGPQPGRSAMLQQRAEQRKRSSEQRDEVRAA